MSGGGRCTLSLSLCLELELRWEVGVGVEMCVRESKGWKRETSDATRGVSRESSDVLRCVRCSMALRNARHVSDFDPDPDPDSGEWVSMNFSKSSSENGKESTAWTNASRAACG